MVKQFLPEWKNQPFIAFDVKKKTIHGNADVI